MLLPIHSSIINNDIQVRMFHAQSKCTLCQQRLLAVPVTLISMALESVFYIAELIESIALCVIHLIGSIFSKKCTLRKALGCFVNVFRSTAVFVYFQIITLSNLGNIYKPIHIIGYTRFQYLFTLKFCELGVFSEKLTKSLLNASGAISYDDFCEKYAIKRCEYEPPPARKGKIGAALLATFLPWKLYKRTEEDNAAIKIWAESYPTMFPYLYDKDGQATLKAISSEILTKRSPSPIPAPAAAH